MTMCLVNKKTANHQITPSQRMVVYNGWNRLILFVCIAIGCGFCWSLGNGVCFAQEDTTNITRAELLRGSVTPEREWWDLLHYDLRVQFFPEEKRIAGTNTIKFQVLESRSLLQIDLQNPLEIERVRFGELELPVESEGYAHFVRFPKALDVGSHHVIVVEYAGIPKVSRNPPWSGGITWSKDDNGNPFIATTCQGIGASIWWPNKDHGYDEPDKGMDIHVTVPGELVAVSNGRLIATIDHEAEGTKTYHWRVTNPINNYGVNVNIGDYVQFGETYAGEAGTLDVSYWVLRNDREAAERQFKEAPRTLQAFEYWFGPYPFYEDSYKLVQVPYLGMEHQSSVTYGNGFKNGYRGSDLSGTGVGLLFDFIIVHESGHEWFGNNISMRDAADMWIHEGFTNYSENLFVEYHFDREKAQDYVIGCRRLIRNDRPIIGQYDANRSGSGDMYYKGGNLLHSLRHIMNDDENWRAILRGLNREFRHQTVTTQQIEDYISERSGIDLTKFFDQYLRTTQIPQFVYEIEGNVLKYRYENTIDGFSYPLDVQVNGEVMRLKPSQEMSTFTSSTEIELVQVDRNFYVEVRELETEQR
ncbi:MAG TPA: M1 family metallopeptidase [Pirellulaceae bacterium]|nr:M1 family metallopeptidase [Pirellulaceae bacterium]HMO93792.1 M1 family metallopeptidase [Pirellulaceae bacterium]HMP70614.1 M1 family metallopeptidase [Pirellulaceae bacterium]